MFGWLRCTHLQTRWCWVAGLMKMWIWGGGVSRVTTYDERGAWCDGGGSTPTSGGGGGQAHSCSLSCQSMLGVAFMNACRAVCCGQQCCGQLLLTASSPFLYGLMLQRGVCFCWMAHPISRSCAEGETSASGIQPASRVVDYIYGASHTIRRTSGFWVLTALYPLVMA